MVQDTLRVPRGNPNGGEFAAKTQTMTEVSLGRADTTLLSIGIGELPKPITPLVQERNSRMNFKASATVAAALAGTLMFGLTGCAPSTSAQETPGATATATSAPVTFPTDGSQAFATGTTVDADTAAALNKAQGETRAWQLTDGTWLTANVNEPVPQVIIDQVQASVHGNADHQPVGGAEVTTLNSELGRYTCQILGGVVDPAGIEWDGYGWTAATGIHPQITFATQSEAETQCHDWAASDGATSRLAIVVNAL